MNAKDSVDVYQGWSLDDFSSVDSSMQRCFELARVATRTDLPVLILGESGTGKTLLATAIHRSSMRSIAAFVSFNAAALSDNLLDSQLFGHEKGAFTDAHRAVKGKFELADGGTLFLDEIADMSPNGQSKILRVVEYGEFERLGSESMRRVDVRVIAATHLSLHELMRTNCFRKDLFYRLNGITITIPPLRERPNDLKALLAFEVRRAAECENKLVRGFTKEALRALVHHSWPGNLRELSRVMHTAVVMADGDIIGREHLLLDNAGVDLIEPSHLSATSQTTTIHELPSEEMDALVDDLSLRSAESGHIQRVLQLMSGNKRKTASALGVSRSTLDRKLAEIGS